MRNPEDDAIYKEFKEQMDVLAQGYGAKDAEGLNPDEFHRIAMDTAWINRATIYGKALVADGLAIDARSAPTMAARCAKVGVTMKEVMEAADHFEDVRGSDARMRGLAAEWAKYEANQAKWAAEVQAGKNRYGDPMADVPQRPEP